MLFAAVKLANDIPKLIKQYNLNSRYFSLVQVFQII